MNNIFVFVLIIIDTNKFTSAYNQPGWHQVNKLLLYKQVFVSESVTVNENKDWVQLE